jgi:hypothetical protein
MSFFSALSGFARIDARMIERKAFFFIILTRWIPHPLGWGGSLAPFIVVLILT